MNDMNSILPDVKLRFNLDHPSLEECYLFGYECALAEVDEEENPYRGGTVEHAQWLDGWWAGFYGEKPLFDLGHVEEQATILETEAANDKTYHLISGLVKNQFLVNVLKITGAIAATAVVGYQVLELVA